MKRISFLLPLVVAGALVLAGYVGDSFAFVRFDSAGRLDSTATGIRICSC